VTFTYEANWKLQLENCSDAYHFTSTHPSYIRGLEERQKATDANVVKSIWEDTDYWTGEGDGVQGGSYSFAGGHALNWGRFGISEAHPLFDRREELAERVGVARRNWIFNMRNLTIFPNLQIAENASSQLRIIRPLAANRTQMQTWCLAPKGESAKARNHRIRQYEDFFNPSGMATPDDTVSYEACQRGFASRVDPWLQGYMRGTTASRDGGNALGDTVGIHPQRSVLSDAQTCDETLYQSYYREWAKRMTAQPQEVLP
jgi:benzoate/toluate 1,2-dioxygenase alpha subunit